jgi:hypothetical protein
MQAISSSTSITAMLYEAPFPANAGKHDPWIRVLTQHLLNGLRWGIAATTYLNGKPACRLLSSGLCWSPVHYCPVPCEPIEETPLARSIVPEISINS